MRTDRICFLDIQFDGLTFTDIQERLRATTEASTYAYLVTPNVDHIVRLNREPKLRPLYEAADYCVCDSRVLKILARLGAVKLPLVPGSDVTNAIFSEIIRPADRVAVIGSDGRSVQELRANFPDVHFLHFEPPMGLRNDPAARAAAAAFIANSNARFTLIAVGSPQQEMIAKEAREHPGVGGLALCIGAGLDFVIGNQKRAPRLMQRFGLEWAHRLATNPRRLWRRYLVDGMRIFPIYVRWVWSSRARSRTLLFLAFAVLALLVVGYRMSAGGRQQYASAALRPSEQPTASVAAVPTLPPPNLLKPVSTQQATEENAERPFVSRADNPAAPFVLRTDPENATRAINCLAQAIYYEAASEGTEGGRAVAQVVLNRMRHPGFPSTVCGVVYEGADRATGCQFSFACDGSLQHAPIPWLWKRSKQIAEQALKGRVFAEVGHATHYHANYVIPYWADSLDKSVQIGKHIFYRLRGTTGDARAFFQHYRGIEVPFSQPSVPILETPDTQRLSDALMGGNTPVITSIDEKTPAANSALLADSHEGTLIADEGTKHQTPSSSRKAVECPATTNKQIGPLKPSDMRVATAPAC